MTRPAARWRRALLAIALVALAGAAQAWAKPARHSPAAKPGRAAAQARPRPLVLPLVVVDAGHGGRDAGAVGPSGTLEKTVALATAQELGRQLRATRHYRVVFTRNADIYVSLPARVRTAVANRAALMISIHTDASTDPRARGASVYVRPAHSESRTIARTLDVPGSARLQLAMVANLEDDLSLAADPARQGRFQVLGALGIPSVLVETGFISNKSDEALLRRPRHRAVIARAIREAVDDFLALRTQPDGPRT